FRNIQRPADIRPKVRLVVTGLCRRSSRNCEWRSVERRSVIRKIKYAMWLVDIEAASTDSSNRNGTTTATSRTASPAKWRAAESAAPLLLQTLAELLNPAFNIFLAASAEILRAPLCTRDAHRFCRSVCSNSV